MKLKKVIALVMAGAITLGTAVSCGSSDSSQSGSNSDSTANAEADTADDTPAEIRDISSWELVKEMKIGWNLGNTMDATGGDGLDAETSWGNPETDKSMIDLLKDTGFNVFRLPVSWGSHMDENYQVDPEWMARVKEIVDYAIDDGMFVILNTHHEDWYFPDGTDTDREIEQLTALWSQIAEEFKNYDEHLIFEGLNEPRLRDTVMEWTGGDSNSRDVVNQYAKAFYDTVRNSGGNNAKRHLMITGYAASSLRTCLSAIDIPENDDKIIISVHAYLPYSFALDTTGTSEYDSSNTTEIDSLFYDLNDLFLSNNIPVIIGEFGSVNKDYNIEDRVECVTYYLNKAKEYGVPCVWWDNGSFAGSGENFGLMDRSLPPAWKFTEIVDAMMAVYDE